MPTESSTPSRLERALSAASVVVLLLGLASIAASLIVGMNDRFAVAEGAWPIFYGLAFFGLPVGFVLLIVTILLAQRRRRAALHEGDTSPREGTADR